MVARRNAATEFATDVDINFSDPAGQRNTTRIHWARNGAALTYDLPTEARLEPDLWSSPKRNPNVPSATGRGGSWRTK